MKYSQQQIREMSWNEWNNTMAQELNDAGFRGKGYNPKTGRWEDHRELYSADPEEPSTFILGTVGSANELNYLKAIGLLNNGRCPLCGKPIYSTPSRFTSGYDHNLHFQICQECCSSGKKSSYNQANNTGCIFALLLLPWHLLKSAF